VTFEVWQVSLMPKQLFFTKLLFFLYITDRYERPVKASADQCLWGAAFDLLFSKSNMCDKFPKMCSRKGKLALTGFYYAAGDAE
jgi:hypothetical protein